MGSGPARLWRARKRVRLWAQLTCGAVAVQLAGIMALGDEAAQAFEAQASEAQASEAQVLASVAAARVTGVAGCGTRTILKPSGTAWRCSFADNFRGDRLNREKWTRMVTASSGFRSGRECYLASGRNVVVRDGRLRLTVRKRAESFLCKSPKGSYRTRYTGGSVSTWQNFSQTYGRFEIRAKFPRTRTSGLHSALWLWPQEPTYGRIWPQSGEIDIAEYYTLYPDRVVPTVHYVGDLLDAHRTNNWCLVHRPDRFHRYTLVWTPRRMTISFDGKVCLVNEWRPLGLRRPAPFDHPFTVNLTQALGRFPNTFLPSRTPLPSTMQVDYVRVWK